MIKRVLLLKLVSWIVLSDCALARLCLGTNTACARQRGAPFFRLFAKL